MQILNRAKYVMTGEDGASNLEIIVWMSVVLVIAGFLFAFRNQIGEFLNGVTGRVAEMDNTLDEQFDAGDCGLPDPAHP